MLIVILLGSRTLPQLCFSTQIRRRTQLALRITIAHVAKFHQKPPRTKLPASFSSRSLYNGVLFLKETPPLCFFAYSKPKRKIHFLMRPKINLSRPIIPFPCLVLLLLLSLPHHHSANAQSGTVSPVTPPIAVNYNHSVALVFVFFVWAFFLVAFFCIYLNDCIDTRAGPVISANRSSNCGLDRAVIESFPTFEVKNLRTVKVTATTLECAVCLGEFEDHETLRLLPKCSHAFHPDCIDAWLASHVTCPICRAKLTNNDTTTTAAAAAATTTTVESTESTQETGGVQNDHVVINVDDDPPRGKFLRSHSTGHSLSRPGVEIDTERYTLRLPEEVMKQKKLRRSSSYDVVFCAAGSLRYTPPFVSIGGSVKLTGLEGNAKGFFTSGKWPLHRLSVKAGGPEDLSGTSPV